MSEITIEVVRGVEGDCLAINNLRVVGPKPWGGGKTIKTWKASFEDLQSSFKRLGFELKKKEPEAR